MTMMIFFFLTLIISAILYSSNPVKASTMVLLAAITLFLGMATTTSKTWIPTLMVMLFMGGIIMMFMILASILPNEKMMASKNYGFFMIFFMLWAFSPAPTLDGNDMQSQMKSFLESGLNFYVIMVMILIYFLSCMSLISSEKSPMRSYSCFYYSSFVSSWQKESNFNHS